MKRKHEQLVEVLRGAREFLARPNNDFAWSSWDDSEAALTEVDAIIEQIAAGNMPKRSDIEVLFAPTGPIQEVSLSSGWGDEFVKLATRFDAAINRAYRLFP